MQTILFPNQLFIQALELDSDILLIEHPLFFTQLPFHSQKLILHHASMRSFRDQAIAQGRHCEIVPLEQFEHSNLLAILQKKDLDTLVFFEPRDDHLSEEIKTIAKTFAVSVKKSPGFLTPINEWLDWQETRKALRMQDFYQWQRKRLNILMEDSKPLGGKWSFDTENRKSIPKDIQAPNPYLPQYTEKEAAYVAEAAARFPNQPGSPDFGYALSHTQAKNALEYFLVQKLSQFGDYEDAVRSDGSLLFHSQLSPLINSGLLTPQQVLDAVLQFTQEHHVPLNSLEGFIRQLIGWREFMALSYLTHGRQIRKSNVLEHHNLLPDSFWWGTTGIVPIDSVVKTVLKTGYAHHIERLMVIGVFMLLTDTDPTEAYRWFSAMFVDAYDWVMVPNVYSMSQYADGGLLTTKPYLCASAYLRRMTDFPVGTWCPVWDSLYWRWVNKHQTLLRGNIRTTMSVATWNKFPLAKQEQLLSSAEQFLATYHA